MKIEHQILLALFIGTPLSAAAQPAPETKVPLREMWDSAYTGADANGPHVLGLWQFDQGAELEDSSAHQQTLALKGAKLAAQGRFDRCLESFCGYPVEDKPHQAWVKNHPRLTPSGAFTLEMWIRPRQQLDADYPEAFLLDKKYVSDDDYQWVMSRANRYGTRTLRMNLGFGADSDTVQSKPARFEPGVWYHIAFTYDGRGAGRFYLNGSPLGGGLMAGRKRLSHGTHSLCIGDRVGSYYHGFPGSIDQVRLCAGVREFGRAKFELASERRVFVRMEPNAQLAFRITNLQRTPMEGALLSIGMEGLASQAQRIAALAPGDSVVVDATVDTGLRPDSYLVLARLDLDGEPASQAERDFEVQIVPRALPDQFPVLMWGGYGGTDEITAQLKRIGFTHVLGLGADYEKIWEAAQPTEAAGADRVAATRKQLDHALANGITVVASLSPGHHMRGHKELLRIDRAGKPREERPDIAALLPPLREYCTNVGVSVARTYGHFPAFGAALIHTEVRDAARPSFHEFERKAFRDFAGYDIPEEAVGPRGISYQNLIDFPADRVIADDHPILTYYRWYWKIGDGWPGLNTALHQGLKSTGRKDFWTFNDPAVRVASLYGSGGEVDYLSQWTYSYPDPIRIGLATDELMAMAGGGRAGQQVMKMTQIIWYRSQTAPMPKEGAQPLPYQAEWERRQPDAPFITIAPMHLREAFWTKMARPIKGIMYHGWQALVETESTSAYRFTHPQTQHELARLIRQVVRPMGPMLRQVPGIKSDVAVLECFTSEMFANRGTYGWCGSWVGDLYLALMYAQLQPDIIFDETIATGGLEGYKVLVMADCDVITSTMAKRIKAFQAAGGLIVGDNRLAPAIKPDLLLAPIGRTGQADRDKQALLALAADLRHKLDSRYRRYFETDNAEIIPYRRRYKSSDYLFLVNDRRQYGAYVGHHGKVMENGLPTECNVVLRRPSGFVYDLVASVQVTARAERGEMRFPWRLGPCDGRLFLVTDRVIERVILAHPDKIPRGTSAGLTVTVADTQGNPLEAVLPVRVDLRDAEGRLAERSGYYAAVDGRLRIKLDIASNDPFGAWTVEVHDLASGHKASSSFVVPGPEVWPPTHQPVPKKAPNAVQPDG
jgi:concanavalin A-like lectin/glucanase superfamily protein